MTDQYHYQENLSLKSPILLDANYKQTKVNKMLAVLQDAGALCGQGGIAVDVGCSIGFFAKGLSPYFECVYGLDIDEHAINMAKEEPVSNVKFQIVDTLFLPFEDTSVDLVICNHVYEHVPDPDRLFKEIMRVLRPGGMCYLGAASRLTIMEPHYHLPFLSWLPKSLANQYMKLAGTGDEYYENLKTYWGIQKMVSGFKVDDYTLRIIDNPDKFFMRDIMPKGCLLDKVPKRVWRLLYQLLPSYIFILRVVEHDN
ncbi:MAG: methyltransferase domain-containing protein [Gammaproteobacteria bacterium]